MKEIKEQLILKANFLNSIISKYEKKGNTTTGYEKSNDSNKKIPLPLTRVQVYKINTFIKEYKSNKHIVDTIKPKLVDVVTGFAPHLKLASNLKKLNIRKKKDYSSFNKIPEGYDPVGVKNEVSEKLYEKLAEIKDLIPKKGENKKNFGKSRRKNKFGSSGQPQSGDDVDIKKIRAEASEELVDIINQELGENLLGQIFKPKIDEDKVRTFNR